jgi:hypothetical protein
VFNSTRAVDPARLDIFKANKHLTYVNNFGQTVTASVPVDSIAIYMDNKLQLRFACGLLPNSNKPFMYYFALVRSRYFDSITSLIPMLQFLKGMNVSMETFV